MMATHHTPWGFSQLLQMQRAGSLGVVEAAALLVNRTSCLDSMCCAVVMYVPLHLPTQSNSKRNCHPRSCMALPSKVLLTRVELPPCCCAA